MPNWKLCTRNTASMETNGFYCKNICLVGRKVPYYRTQTKIKNYFYGNVRYLLKIIIKTVTSVKAGFINDIKTDTLLDIY